MQDDIARRNAAAWNKLAADGQTFTQPWLDIDMDVLRAWIASDDADAVPPKPFDYLYPNWVLRDVAGKDVLCLAAGGGQQSAVHALLGANVTVVDVSEGQIAGDRIAADHYGYAVRAMVGDMRDLSAFADASFDVVHQGPSMCYIPDVRQVYAEVARVLRPGGLYRTDVSNPATEFVDPEHWDGKGYAITKPYIDKIRNREDGGVEFRHHMGDLFTGLIEVGLELVAVIDSPEMLHPRPDAEPGAWWHWLGFAGGFAIVARKSAHA